MSARTSIICLLRGVNVGGRGLVKMTELKAVFETLGFAPVQTVLQSGNVVFTAKHVNLPAIANAITAALKEQLIAEPEVILRTAAEMREIVARNPLVAEASGAPGHLLVHFLSGPADKGSNAKLSALARPPEKFLVADREVYIHYANGAARSKLGGPAMDNAVGRRGTARNWNTILKLLALAESV